MVNLTSFDHLATIQEHPKERMAKRFQLLRSKPKAWPWTDLGAALRQVRFRCPYLVTRLTPLSPRQYRAAVEKIREFIQFLDNANPNSNRHPNPYPQDRQKKESFDKTLKDAERQLEGLRKFAKYRRSFLESLKEG